MRDGRGGIRQGSGGAVGFEFRSNAVEATVVENPVAPGVGIGSRALDRQFLVEVEQIEIGGGDVAKIGRASCRERV